MNNGSFNDSSSVEKQLDERLLELTALFEISRSLTSSLSIKSVLENILRIPMGHMLIKKGLVLIRNEEENDYEFIVKELKGLPRNLIGKTIEINDPPQRAFLLNEADSNESYISSFMQFGIQLVLPLNSSQGTIGIVGFGEKINGSLFSESEIEFLDSLSNIAATAVSNGLNVEEIRRINRNLDRKIQQLNTIFDISRELNTTLDKKKIGSLLSFAVMGELMVNRCAVYMKSNNSMHLIVNKGASAIDPSDSSLCDVSAPVLLEKSSAFKKYSESGLKMLVPMRIQEEVKGILAVGPKISGIEFDMADIEFLTTLGNQAIASLENARLFEETLEKQRMEEELHLARTMQKGLLPSQLPTLEKYDIAAVNMSSREVGGDYYDVIKIDDSRYGLAIADVSGKGAGAALLMANLQASLHALISTNISIPEMIKRINNLIYRNTALDKFITFFYAEMDISRQSFTFCNAGHNPPCHVSEKGNCTELMTGGLILGMMPNVPFETETIMLKPGDRIVMYTDGITEAMNTKEEEFGEQRLMEIINRNTAASALSLVDTIVAEVKQFAGDNTQADDITMVVLRAKPG